MPSSRPASRRSDPPVTSSSDSAVWYRRLPLAAICLTLLLLLSALFAVPAIRDAATLRPVIEAHLEFPAGYLLLAPLSDVLDHLTLLTIPQHIALVLWAVAIFAVVRWTRGRSRPRSGVREGIAAGLFVLGVLIVYAAAAALPRPMAQLQTTDLTVLAIDFHTHTRYSHDGRTGWEPRDVRAWHEAAGFDAAYITDHRTLDGATEGIAGNASQAGQGVLLLQGLEAGYHGEHVNILGAGNHFNGITTPDLRDVDDQALALASLVPNGEPVLIETLPGNLSHLIAAPAPGTAGLRAIELLDGSPRGLTQSRADRARIVRLADSLDLALVAGTDNHGWGRATPGWTMMRVIDWRSLGTDSLSQRIERVMRIGRRGSSKVFERRVADADPLSVAFAGVTVPWRMFTTLGGEERMAWFVWIWAIVLLIHLAESSRTRDAAKE